MSAQIGVSYDANEVRGQVMDGDHLAVATRTGAAIVGTVEKQQVRGIPLSEVTGIFFLGMVPRWQKVPDWHGTRFVIDADGEVWVANRDGHYRVVDTGPADTVTATELEQRWGPCRAMRLEEA